MRVARDQGSAPVRVSPTRRVTMSSWKDRLQVVSSRADCPCQPAPPLRAVCVSAVLLSTEVPLKARTSVKAFRLDVLPLPCVPYRS